MRQKLYLRQWRPAMHVHLFIAAPLHSDKRHTDERGRDHPHPHHVGQLNSL